MSRNPFQLRAPALAVALSVALDGCSLSDKKSSSSPRSSADQAPPPRQGPVQQTRVRVIEGIGSKGGFDPGTIYKRLAPGP